MGFVPGFDSDVFVSYATANNQELIQGKPGWVTSFRDILKKLLDEGLDRRNASEVWMDYKLRGNEPFEEQLKDTVTNSAVLVIVLSEAYVNSPWCNRELEIFLNTTKEGHSRSGCIFLVHYEPVALERWPQGLQGLSNEKYRFFQQEREGAPSRPLGFPILNAGFARNPWGMKRGIRLSKMIVTSSHFESGCHEVSMLFRRQVCQFDLLGSWLF